MRKGRLFVFVWLMLFLTACSNGTLDTEPFYGELKDGKTIGYEYAITKNSEHVVWEVVHKGRVTSIVETTDNQEDLEKFMTAVDDSSLELFQFVITCSYFLLVIVIGFFLFVKNRKLFKEIGIAVGVFAGISLYIMFNTMMNLFLLLKDIRYYYPMLMN
ncbi:hypothetical protein FZW96_13910 [Bacillus sp. BGMRC 2118]|nr:hypothetical protein FZW96_13910 [Bacillus sp. BGMRC 2118]